MDGERLREYLVSETQALLANYRQFETLIPAKKGKGSSNKSEDGRYIEALLKDCLKKYLPKELELLSGFILRPAVKTGKSGRERKNGVDLHSSQLDIIVFNSANYPIFQRFEDIAVVPPEGVVAIISVKKHLEAQHIKQECTNLFKASKLCSNQYCVEPDKNLRGPFLALVGMGSNIEKNDFFNWIFTEMKKAYPSSGEGVTFDNLIGYIGAIDTWSLFKKRPTSGPTEGEYIVLEHKCRENHLGLQFLLTGILSVYYDETRNSMRRPGFTAFPSKRNHDIFLGSIKCNSLR